MTTIFTTVFHTVIFKDLLYFNLYAREVGEHKLILREKRTLILLFHCVFWQQSPQNYQHHRLVGLIGDCTVAIFLWLSLLTTYDSVVLR